MRLEKLSKDEGAQTSLFDAVMFFTVMLIASMLIFIFSSQAFQTQEVMERETMITYTEEARGAILQSSVYEAWYYDINGNKIVKSPGNNNINDLLLEELALLDDGVPRDNFEEGYENQINYTLARLIRTGYDYALQAIYTNKTNDSTHEIFISTVGSNEDIPSGDVTVSQWSQPMVIHGKEGYAVIKLIIWRS